MLVTQFVKMIHCIERRHQECMEFPNIHTTIFLLIPHNLAWFFSLIFSHFKKLTTSIPKPIFYISWLWQEVIKIVCKKDLNSGNIMLQSVQIVTSITWLNNSNTRKQCRTILLFLSGNRIDSNKFMYILYSISFLVFFMILSWKMRWYKCRHQ